MKNARVRGVFKILIIALYIAAVVGMLSSLCNFLFFLGSSSNRPGGYDQLMSVNERTNIQVHTDRARHFQ